MSFIPLFPMMQYFVARQQDWYAQAGIRLVESRFSSGPPIVQALAAGEVDVAYIGISPANVSIARGVPAQVVVADAKETNVILAGETLAQLWDTLGPGAFEKFKKTQGRRARIVTLPKGSTPDLMLRFWIIEKLGLALDDVVEIVPVGAPQVLQALTAGGIDGASVVEPSPTLAAAVGLPFRPIVFARDILTGQPGAVLEVTQKVIDQRPDLVEKLVEIHLRATDFIRKNPAPTATFASQVIGSEVLSIELARQALDSQASCFVSDPHAIEAGALVYNDFQNRLEIVDRRLSSEDIFDFSFYDKVVARQPDLAISEC